MNLSLRPLVGSLAGALIVMVAVACSSSSSSSPNVDYSGSCRLLASRCHGVKSAIGDECHDLGHAGDDAKCGPRKDECLAACPEGHDEGEHDTDDADSGADVVDAGGDADVDAAPHPCVSYCACMKATCADEPSYPFAGDDECLAECATFSASDLACYASSCESAKVAADKEHDCEHATGEIECH